MRDGRAGGPAGRFGTVCSTVRVGAADAAAPVGVTNEKSRLGPAFPPPCYARRLSARARSWGGGPTAQRRENAGAFSS